MPKDSETLDETYDEENEEESAGVKKRDDFPGMFADLFCKISFKKTFWLFIIGMIIFSDLFINSVLEKFSDTTDGVCPNTKGTSIQMVFLCMLYICMDLLVECGIL